MDTVVRWSPHSTADRRHFVLLDVTASRMQLCSLDTVDTSPIQYSVLASREKLPNYAAFDFSKTDPYVFGFGGQSGEATIVQLDPDKAKADNFIFTFNIRSQRRCNSLAMSLQDHVVCALDRARNDHCLHIFDINSSSPNPRDSIRKLAMAEGIASVKFFNREPDTLLAGVQKQCIRIYDLRDNANNSAPQFPTRLVHNLAIDPLDENYFISAGPEKEPTVAVWDRRVLRSGASTPSSDIGGHQGPVLEMRTAIDNSHSSSISSLRFCGVKRGCFEVLSNSGELRAFELAQHSLKPGLGQGPPNSMGGTPWLFPTYARRTHTLAYPAWSQNAPRDEKQRIVSCDFISAPGIGPSTSLLVLTQDRKIKRVPIHDVPRKVNITALDEIWLWKDRPKVLKQRERLETSSDELVALQVKASLGTTRKISEQALTGSASRLENLSLQSSVFRNANSYESPYYTSSGDQHEDLLSMNFPEFIPSAVDMLKLLPIQRRRCEEGYSMDAQRNQKIVANDPWLVDMWDTIKRFDDFARNDGMFHNGIDLAFLGVYAVWTGDFSTRNRLVGRESFTPNEYNDAIRDIVKRKGYPPFTGHKTHYTSTRQLCLALCGWTFSKDILRQRCQLLMDVGQIYKAIVVAVMRGFKDLALELLKIAIQSKKLQNIGLGAVIACESVNDEQREMCSWMAEETDDPYLKALLAYFVSGDWKVVVDMPLLPLSDRIGCAVKYIDDDRLGEFIKVQTRVAVVAGNTEGLVLTGLSERAIDLFRHYISKFNDLQTALLSMSFSCPVYVSDDRFEMWRDTYLMQMQHWRAFNERTSYLDLHSRRSKARSGARFGTTTSRPVSIRCTHCMAPLALHTLRKTDPTASGSTPPGTLVTTSAPRDRDRDRGKESAAARSGLVCAHCSRAMPHCGICGLLLGGPDPRRFLEGPNGAAAAEMLAREDPLSRQAVYCMTCMHVSHGHHARDWFARHKMCPVPDCQCMCGFLH
jgi:hypothetical protein